MADLVFCLHVMAGIVLVFFWPYKSLYIIYITVLTVSVLENSILDFCFLAKWECYFRKKLNPSYEMQTFLDHYLKRFFGINVSPRQVHVTVLVTLWTLVGLNIAYWLFIYVRK
ncbi:MAG: DUF2784 family protein [Patescibacteria group bacterium]|nr:DUF2784 family protein [Patescibacteria group bacterium]